MALLEFLADQGHKVSKKKLQLAKQQVTYLGHSLTAEERKILPDRKQAIMNAPKPETKKPQMMSFLGMINFCRSWICDYAEKVAPLQALIYTEQMSMQDRVKWTSEAEAAFTDIKTVLISTETQAFPDYSKPFRQTVDCKGEHMTSVLMQQHGDKWKPVAYYSCMCTSGCGCLRSGKSVCKH